MSDLRIGPWTIQGTDPQNTILQPMAEKMAAVLALPDATFRVRDAKVIVKPRNEMPWARKPGTNGPNDKGVRSRGYWNGTNQLLADDLFPTPDLARKTFAHETIHQLDDQWMLRSNRKDIKPLFEPDATGWPAEPFAVYGSAALFGFTNPPYQNFYPDNKIPVAEWPKVKEFALRDDHVDPCQEWIDKAADLAETVTAQQAEIDRLNALLAEISQDNTELAAMQLTVANKGKVEG